MSSARYEIVNVVATAVFNQKIDLEKVARAFPNASYTPRLFPGLVLRLEKPKASFLIFSSGKVVCTGTRSEGEAIEAIRRLYEKLVEEKTISPVKYEANVQNIVCTGSVEGRINLDKAAASLEGVIYEPEQFPGLIYRGLHLVFLLFASGRFVCAGSKSEKTLEDAVKRLRIVLDETKLVERAVKSQTGPPKEKQF